MAGDYRGTSNVRGIRNNNPGNLRPSGSTWQGQVAIDDNFIVFENMKWGCRALATDLTNKFYRGLNTIRKIISVYAPPSENNTEAYINAVSQALGISADATIDLTKSLLAKFMRAVITHENGAQGYIVTESEIQEGIAAMSPNLLLKIKGF